MRDRSPKVKKILARYSSFFNPPRIFARALVRCAEDLPSQARNVNNPISSTEYSAYGEALRIGGGGGVRTITGKLLTTAFEFGYILHASPAEHEQDWYRR